MRRERKRGKQRERARINEKERKSKSNFKRYAKSNKYINKLGLSCAKLSSS